MKIRIRNRQTLLDIAMQATGTIESVFEIAKRNDLGVTAALSANQELDILDSGINDLVVLEDYERKTVYPATGLKEMAGIDFDLIPNLIY